MMSQRQTTPRVTAVTEPWPPHMSAAMVKGSLISLKPVMPGTALPCHHATSRVTRVTGKRRSSTDSL